MAGHRMPIDVDLVTSGPRLGDGLDRDVVVAERLHLDTGKHLAERRRNPADLARVRAPDDDRALLLGRFIKLRDLRRVAPSRLREIRNSRCTDNDAKGEDAVKYAPHVRSSRRANGTDSHSPRLSHKP